ncbi:MAG: hypothetical protein EXS14_08670 [Planctomycetes bacterium]|nr:hypothetical protein [Planctomycetota bacterium]
MNLGMVGRARVAGIVWLGMGSWLLARGLAYREAAGESAQLALILGVVIGVAKGLTVLRKSSRRVIARIEASPGKAPVWTIWPKILLLLIPLMIAFGWSLRHYYGESNPEIVLGVYSGIGAALIASSFPYFMFAARH